MARDNSYKKPTDKIITIPVSPELHKKIRVAAAEFGLTVKELGTKALETYIQDFQDG